MMMALTGIVIDKLRYKFVEKILPAFNFAF